MLHIPVMPVECMELLDVRPEGIYLDATTGLGGHTSLIAQRLTSGMVIANDRDPESLELARGNTESWKDRIRFHRGTFATLGEAVREAGFDKIAGVLADLGVSRHQLTTPQRGFSFMADGPLDMRMDPTMGTTAADLVNFTDEKTLADLIYQFGEERRARRVARALVQARPIRSTLHLADVVLRAVPRTGRLHPATKTFMALRMAVNDETGELERLLAIVPELLKPGGRLVIVSFMSLDDRVVKHRFRDWAREDKCAILTKHPLQPTELELAQNPASRSAKTRAVQWN
jgi:16S rRNA (cytosine1402-N4)-methyltransferase